jgi:hypothetical protein
LIRYEAASKSATTFAVSSPTPGPTIRLPSILIDSGSVSGKTTSLCAITSESGQEPSSPSARMTFFSLSISTRGAPESKRKFRQNAARAPSLPDGAGILARVKRSSIARSSFSAAKTSEISASSIKSTAPFRSIFSIISLLPIFVKTSQKVRFIALYVCYTVDVQTKGDIPNEP